MKDSFISRAAVLALALFLALALTVSLTGPGLAEAADEITVSLSETSLTLGVDGTTKQLTVSVSGAKPEAKVTVIWSIRDEDKEIVELTESADGMTCTVKAVSHGEATITATVSVDGEQVEELTCKVTVHITLSIGGELVWTNTTPDNAKFLALNVIGEKKDAKQTVEWTVEPETAQAGVVPPTLSGDGVTSAPEYAADEKTIVRTKATGGLMVTVNQQTAGIFTVTAKYYENDVLVGEAKPVRLVICGLVLSGADVVIDTNKETGAIVKTLTMMENGSAGLSVVLCSTTGYSSTRVEWTSDNAYVCSVMPDAGSLNAWHEGTAEITVRTPKGEYEDYCTVTVEADTSAVADNGGKYYTASISARLKFMDEDRSKDVRLYDELNKISNEKTGADLNYITNLWVSTDQGTLFYNYSTEADTGYGVGTYDQFAPTASGSIKSFYRLSFVPKPGFSGIADITFTCVSNKGNFAGVIKVNVVAGSGTDQISYSAKAGEPVWFSLNDFETFCLNKNGRSFSYITFNLPKASDGVLYYNYAAGSGNPVTTDLRFYQSGRYSLSDVCFVPNVALADNSEVTIGFRAVDTSGTVFDGEVTVGVTAVTTGSGQSTVTVTGEQGKPVTLQSSLFYDACRETIGDTLSFVTFKLPDPSEGILYYNYRSDGTSDGRVTAGAHYYYSGVPGLSGVSFVPASGAAGRVAISYTGYGVGGSSYSGTLYIVLEETGSRSTIYYSVAKGGSVTFSTSDFYNAGLNAAGSGVSYVRFTDLSSGYYNFDFGSVGRLFYNYRSSTLYSSVSPGSNYYYSPSNSWYQRLSLISFRAGSETGTVTIPYTAYDSKGNTLFSGKVVIQVGTATPNDVVLSCRNGDVTDASQLSMQMYNACSAVMNAGLSYIEITSVPDAKVGRLYFNYRGFGTGIAVQPGDQFNLYGSPSFSLLTFVPHAGFSGEVEITYIGYSNIYTNSRREQVQDQVSGRILINVTRSTGSQYFTDMSGQYWWAGDSVDYLHRNKSVSGVGNNRFDPSGIVTRGDFTLMVVKAYGLTATGSASFSDVSAGKYYADAVRVAHLLGIVSGYNGKFNPDAPLTRQDAIVILNNVLKYSGKTVTNGLAADFSVYRDENQISSYAREAMGALIQLGVVSGTGDNCLSPLRQLTRAEAAMLLHSIMTL